MTQETKGKTAKETLQDITSDISWFVFARSYMHKSYSWFIKKFKGLDGSGQAASRRPSALIGTRTKQT
ncbi:MAG: hypothetical protein Q4A61_00765 [Porphyromonadaceae bacterium]|nr:hypothetical protein [Porphyromonadaceae bacterium]